MLDGLEVIYIARHDGLQPIRFMASDVGRRLPATCTALGKASLAALAINELEARVRGVTELPRLTSHSLGTVAELRADLAEVRSRGYAVDDEETTEGVVCYAVAVPPDDHGDDVHAVSVTMLKARVTGSHSLLLVNDLRELAERLHRV
jgi:DNA-binding IclR family transcriptional regulator